MNGYSLTWMPMRGTCLSPPSNASRTSQDQCYWYFSLSFIGLFPQSSWTRLTPSLSRGRLCLCFSISPQACRCSHWSRFTWRWRWRGSCWVAAWSYPWLFRLPPFCFCWVFFPYTNMTAQGNLHWWCFTLPRRDTGEQTALKPILIILEGSGAKMPQFDDNIIILLPDGLDNGMNNREANIIRTWPGIFFLFLSFFTPIDNWPKRCITLCPLHMIIF